MATNERFVVTGDQSLRFSNASAELSRQLFLQRDTKLDPERVIATIQGMTESKLSPFVGGVRAGFWAPRTARIEIGGIPKDALIERVRAVRQLDYAGGMMRRDEFTVLPERETAMQIDLSPRELGFTENPLRDDLLNNDRLAAWSEANLDGYVVELNPAEVGPHMAIQYTSQPKGEHLLIGMRPLPGADGNLSVFCVKRYDDGAAWLHGRWNDPGDRFGLDARVSFRLRKASASAV